MDRNDFEGTIRNASEKEIAAGVMDAEVFNWLREGASLALDREALDTMYRGMRRQGIAKPEAHFAAMANSMQLAIKNPDMLDGLARDYADKVKNPQLVRAIDGYAETMGVPSDTINRMWSQMISVHEIPVDPRLTDDEKAFLNGIKAIMKHGFDKGYFTSTVNDAPLDSDWAMKTKRQAAAKGSPDRSS